jgi:transposase InsO family protein
MRNAPKGKLLIPQHPGARWELDHALLPIPVCVECVGPNGDLVRIRVGKVWVTIVIDVATRFVLAMVFGIDPPSSARTLAALKMAMTAKAEIFEKYGIENRLDVCIVPTLIVFDNGKDLHSADVLAATGDLNIVHVFAGAYHGDHKPFVERFIRTVKAFLRKTPGATDKGQRDRGPKRTDVPEPEPIPIEDVERIAWKWLMDTYHIRPHSGLWKDKPANVMKRGLERLVAERKNAVPLPFRPTMVHYTALECDAMFSIRLVRPVDTRGVRYKYLWWNSGELGRMISETKCTQVDVRLNPANLGTVLVWHPTNFTWISVPCLYAFYAEGLSLWYHERILARIHEHERIQNGGKLPRNFSIDIRKYLKNEGELLAEMIDLAGMKKPSVGQARQAARFLGSKLDFALGVARMDAIDIRMGKKPPGYGALIDLKKGSDGTYYAESKPNPKSKDGRFDYRAPESIADPETPERSSDGVSQTTPSNVDMITNPIAGFDPNAGLL